MQELRLEWVRTQDTARQKQLAEEIQKLAYDEVSYVPLGQYTLQQAYRKHVKGILPFVGPILWNVWLEK
jgi:peptide/nickel transport system substrate-binding protein